MSSLTEYQDLLIVCKHSFEKGEWGSILNEKFAHHPSRFQGGCWICEICRKAVSRHLLNETNVVKTVFTDVAIAARKALTMGTLPNRPEMFFVPDLSSQDYNGLYPLDFTSDTELLYDKDNLYCAILMMAQAARG